MIASKHARYVPDLMDERSKAALMDVLEGLYLNSFLKDAWPAAYDAREVGNSIPLCKIDIVVLSLDRIGAPFGASGAKVFISYFSHRDSDSDNRRRASPPLVVKIGTSKKLKSEYDIRKDWPTLSQDIRSHFAIPIDFREIDSDLAVLIAPFRSHFWLSDDGIRLNLKHADLWYLLSRPEELRIDGEKNWAAIETTISHALDTVDHVHRNNKAKYLRSSAKYSEVYCRYLRNTFAITGTDAKHSHIPKHTFGSAEQVSVFGRSWSNPSRLISEIMNASDEFEGTMGPVHGDLHPKNIVIGHADSV